MKECVLKLYLIVILTIQTGGFIVPRQTKFYRIQNVCMNDIFHFDFKTHRNSGLLMHLEPNNSKQHQLTVTFEDGDLEFTYGVNNKTKSFIIPYDDIERINRLNDYRWHKFKVERILDGGKYLSLKVVVDEQIHRFDSVMELDGNVRESNDVYLGETPHINVKNAIYINCKCLKMHSELGRDRSEVNKLCLEKIKNKSVIKSCSTRRYSMNGFASNFTMDQTITFNECQHSPFRQSFNSMRQFVTRNSVMNDRNSEVFRFSSTNLIGALGGVIKSYSTRKFETNGFTFSFTIDQTITFNECQHSPFRHSLSFLRHVATRNLVMNDRKNDVLRFSSTNQICEI
ncbi:unnamed protein product [Mytilus coruscus]|uniref:Laminin G domain-containing protein n=1 Tax=Mytilus coruscus TaxID=42192 RepID=A0A6J8E951_MYTCO|nr:unnamed protein product [Mytilus coruscus]